MARNLHIARPRAKNDPSWLTELRLTQPVSRKMTVSNLCMHTAFEAIISLVALHGFHMPEITVDWLHEFFKTDVYMRRYPELNDDDEPRNTTFDFLSTLIRESGMADVASDTLRTVFPKANTSGFLGYCLTEEGRVLLNIDNWPAPLSQTPTGDVVVLSDDVVVPPGRKRKRKRTPKRCDA